MFQTLKNRTTLETGSHHDDVISNETLDFLIENLSDVPSDRIDRMDLRKTRGDLCALITSIKTYGLSPSLLAFVNYNNNLGDVVKSIPSIESLKTDLSADQAATIVSDLTTLLHTLESAEEGLIEDVSVHALKAVVSLLVTKVFSIVDSIVCNRYKTWKEDRENRRASVIPFDTLTKLLHAVDTFPRVVGELITLTLPRTEEDYKTFLSNIDTLCSPLSALGIHVSNEDINVTTLPSPQKESIEILGYKENSLNELSILADHVKTNSLALKSISFNSLDYQLRTVQRNDRHFVKKGYSLTHDIIKTGIVRVMKILVLTKTTINTIKKFYK